ncbi:MAG TPA: hypothetical protein VMM79_15575 [Longimicrobiales bacterium]|nr:hypothetical protein [Longimicrobiales bacterium]
MRPRRVGALARAAGSRATAIVSGLRRTGANAGQATADLVERGFGCSDVAVGMHAAGYDATEIYTALSPRTQPPTPGPNPPPPGKPHIASFRVNQDDPIAYSREVDIAWDITGCAATQVRVSEQASFAGATWRSLGQAHSLADIFPGASTYSLDPDTPGQKTIHIQFRNAAGEGALASASVEYRRLLSITDVRLNQNATETNNRALEVDVAIDGAAPTHIRMAEQNIQQEPWQAIGDMFAFNSQSIIAWIELPDHAHVPAREPGLRHEDGMGAAHAR